jgi:hypothetical protein
MSASPRAPRAAAAVARAALASLLVLHSAAGPAQQPGTVPKKYQALYAELDAALTALERELPQAPDAPVLRAAVLASTRCDANEEMLDPSRREALALELTALRNVGADAAVVEVCYPLLTPAFQEPRLALEHYAAAANEIRSRGLKVVVRHTLLPVGRARPALQRYWTRLSRQRFEAERYEESKAILYAMRPDYLTLQADRAAQPAGNRLVPRDWARLTQSAAERLRADAGSTDTLIGAGVGPAADSALLDALAAARGLDYIDLQLYPVWFGGHDQMQHLLQWPSRVRAADPARRVIVSETWLRKLSRSDAAKPISEEQLLSREAYSFWEPLDQRYLTLLGQLARGQAIELVGVAHTRQLFAYLDFYDPILFRLNNRAVIELLQRDFATAVRGQPPNAVGRAFGAM